MLTFGGGTFFSGQVAFPSVPNTCLDPTKNIVVEFDYAFDAAPGSTGGWNVTVFNSASSASNHYFNIPATSQSGHFSFTVNNSGFPTANQSAFTTTATDPSLVAISVLSATGITSLTVTNVAIHFNQ